MANNYLPNRDVDKKIWLNTFSNKINQPGSPGATIGEDLNLTAAEVSQTADDAAMFAFCVQNQDSVQWCWYRRFRRSGHAGLPKNWHFRLF